MKIVAWIAFVIAMASLAVIISFFDQTRMVVTIIPGGAGYTRRIYGGDILNWAQILFMFSAITSFLAVVIPMSRNKK